MDTNQAVHIRSIQFLHGPNVYAYMPVQQAIIDIEAYDYQPRTHWPGRVERLTTWLPGLASHIVSPNRPGGFYRAPHTRHLSRANCGTPDN